MQVEVKAAIAVSDEEPPLKRRKGEAQPGAGEAPFPVAPSVAELAALAAKGRLSAFVRWRKWPSISTPSWEGRRWRTLLEELRSGKVSEEELFEEVKSKLRRSGHTASVAD